jgi:hypothetical protein
MRKLTHRFGHRAIFIYLIGFAWLAFAVTIALGNQVRVDHLFHTFFPIWLRVLVWTVPALVGMVVARTRFEWTAFFFLSLAPAERLSSYWVGAGIDFYLGDTILAWEYVGRGLVYFLIILLMWLIAVWPNPIDLDDLDSMDPDFEDGDSG